MEDQVMCWLRRPCRRSGPSASAAGPGSACSAAQATPHRYGTGTKGTVPLGAVPATQIPITAAADVSAARALVALSADSSSRDAPSNGNALGLNQKLGRRSGGLGRDGVKTTSS